MQLKMLGKVCHFTFIFTCCSACVFGANNKNTQKRSTTETHWFRERINHNGLTLSDNDLTKVAQLGDESHFKQTLGPILIPRVVDTPGHTAVRKFIIDEMESMNWTVESHRFDDRTPVGRKTFTNVIATLDPSARRRLVLACHYDSKITPTGFLGATDSAVPCSMMINLAHVMKGSLKELRDRGSNVTLQFLFFDGEEAFKRWSDTDSLYGARKLAHKLHNTPFPTNKNKYDTSELHRIDLFVLLDLIGTEDCTFTSLFENSQRWYDKLVGYERNLIDLNLMSRRTPMFKAKNSYGSRIEDDHVPFLQRGVPILHLISAPFPGVWHRISDNGNALHYSSIANMNTIMRAFVADYLHLKL